MPTRIVITFTCPTNAVGTDEGVDGWFPSGETMLRRFGHFCTLRDLRVDRIVPYKFYGWKTRVTIGGRTIAVLLQYPDDYVIMIEQEGAFNWYRASRTTTASLEEARRLVIEWVHEDCRGDVRKIDIESGHLSC